MISMIKTKYIIISLFVVAITIPVSFMASAMRSDKPLVQSALVATPAVAPIVLIPEKPTKVIAQNTVAKPAVKKAVVKKKVVKKKATKKKEKLTLQPALITPETAPHSPKKR